jgi:hypothetical protein
MEKVTDIRQGVEKLLTVRGREIPEFSFIDRQEDGFTPVLLWEGKQIPLFTTRYDPRIRSIANYGSDAENNSALNVYAFTGSDVSLDRLIYREFCIAEFILHSKVKKIMAFVNQNAANIIAVMENDTTANIDLGNTMAPGAHYQSQHRLITKHGMANDLSAADMTVQHQVYIFGENGTSVYDDDEYYLYGLNEEEVETVLTIHGIFTGHIDCTTWAEDHQRYVAMIKAVYDSAEAGKAITLN